MIRWIRFERVCMGVSSAFCLTYGPLSTHPEIAHAVLSASFLPAAAAAAFTLLAPAASAWLAIRSGRRADAVADRDRMMQETLDQQRREAQEMMSQRDRRIFAQPPSPDQRPPRPWSLDT